MIRLLYLIFVWVPSRPLIGLVDFVLVRVGLKYYPATGPARWRRNDDAD